MSEFKYYAAGESESQAKQFDAYLFKQQNGGAPGFASAGVLAGLGVSQTTTASASVVVGSGMGVVQSSITAGVDRLNNNADKTVDVLGASPMGSVPRNDLIVFDSATASIRVLPGTPNASPTDPAAAPWQLTLARIRHAANALTVPASAIDDLRVFTSLNLGLLESGWTSYSPSWTTGASSPLVNNGSLTGRFKDIGKTRLVHVEFVRGSSTEAGNNTYAFGLPSGVYRSFRVSGSGYYVDASPFTEVPLTPRGIGAGVVALLLPSGGRLSYNTVAWAASDEIVFDLAIELA